MRLISSNKEASDVFDFCQDWLEALSGGDYGAANEMIVPDGHYRWSPGMIEKLIANYGHTEPLSSGRRCQVTSADAASGTPSLACLRVADDEDTVSGQVHEKYPFAVYWFLDGPSRRGALGWLHLDYPLDGAWCDLSSIFDIVARGDQLGFDLERIEVL